MENNDIARRSRRLTAIIAASSGAAETKPKRRLTGNDYRTRRRELSRQVLERWPIFDEMAVMAQYRPLLRAPGFVMSFKYATRWPREKQFREAIANANAGGGAPILVASCRSLGAGESGVTERHRRLVIMPLDDFLDLVAPRKGAGELV
jgi:hypothetical protein